MTLFFNLLGEQQAMGDNKLLVHNNSFFKSFAHPLPPQIYGNCQGEYRVVDERLGISLVSHPLMFSRVLHHPPLLKKVHLGVTPISSLVDDGKKLVPPNLVNFFFLKNKHNNFPLFSHFFQKVFFASPNNPSSTISPSSSKFRDVKHQLTTSTIQIQKLQFSLVILTQNCKWGYAV